MNEADENFLRLTKKEMHNELGIEMDEFAKSEDEGSKSIPPKDLEPEAKRLKLSNAAEKRQRAKPKITSKRKKSISVGEADKENASPNKKKAKKAEKPIRKQKVYTV